MKAHPQVPEKEEVEPVTAEVTAQVLEYCRIPRKATEIMELLKLKHWKTFQTNYLKPSQNFMVYNYP
ncbi:MAG: hypothetical protein GY834_04595 [Bacteroidetes bacterium]|nr:hypothetical protein [Bacteroidota bacterium]